MGYGYERLKWGHVMPGAALLKFWDTEVVSTHNRILDHLSID